MEKNLKRVRKLKQISENFEKISEHLSNSYHIVLIIYNLIYFYRRIFIK